MDALEESQTVVPQYHEVSTREAFDPYPVYTLQRYSWRSFLSILGPLVLLGFYTFICFHYLDRMPENDIVLQTYPDAMVPFFIWLVVSVFILDWARTALSNFQAAVLMHPTTAPANAMTLFWHADDNWANPLWWLRALRNFIFTLTWRRKQRFPQSNHLAHYKAHPGLLWTLLSSISMLVFMAIPLSGLTMEVTTVSTPGKKQATILGPKATTFNMKGLTDLPSTIYGTWKAGRQATPPDLSYFYAPDGSKNVSATYFEDQSRQQPARGFSSFLGPATNDVVIGSAFGLESTIQCSQVPAEKMKLILVNDWGNYSVRQNYPSSTCKAQIQWYNETGFWSGKNAYSLVAAADGSWYGDTPYTTTTNRDLALYNSCMNITEPGAVPDAFFEMYLWQGIHPNFSDPVIEWLLLDQSTDLKKTERNVTYQYVNQTVQLVGFGLQCQVRSAYGKAEVFPNTRTYKNFEIRNVSVTGTDHDVYPPQILSVEALGQWQIENYKWKPRNPENFESNWPAMHLAIEQPAYEVCNSTCPAASGFGTQGRFAYTTLSPQNVKFAMYRLLGQSLIAMMGSGSQLPWEGELYLLEPARWLRPGPVSWKLVLVLLAFWAVVIVCLSIWTLFTKRWAPVLSGFELFRFGAQYTDEVNKFNAGRFEECNELYNIPGMVGALPGSSADGSYGFIGLSENVASQDGQYVHDRNGAGMYRKN